MKYNQLKKITVLSTLLTVSFAWSGAMAQDTVFLRKQGERPFVTVFKPKSTKQSDVAVVVCSGGSYRRTADVEEGIPAAKLLAENGITAFLCDYRVPAQLTLGKDSIPFSDAQIAITFVREHAKTYGISKSKVGIMGFSAGGHLASTVGTHDHMDFDNQGAGKNLRPDFMVLVYPLISMRTGITTDWCRDILLGKDPADDKVQLYSNELQVTENTPPTYTVFAIDDPVVKVSNGLLLDAALAQNGVEHHLFLYEKGGHGYGVNNKLATVQWPKEVIPWILTIAYN